METKLNFLCVFLTGKNDETFLIFFIIESSCSTKLRSFKYVLNEGAGCK